MASSAGGNVEAGGAAGAVAVWWVACSAASGWCRMLRAVVGGLDCGGLSLASSPLRTQVTHLGFGRPSIVRCPCGVRPCGWLQGLRGVRRQYYLLPMCFSCHHGGSWPTSARLPRNISVSGKISLQRLASSRSLTLSSPRRMQALILHKNAKELFRCRRCSAVVDTGAPIPIDDRRPPMGGGASALQVTPNSNTFVLDISSLDSSLWHYFPAD